jgi:hypothetical protein
VNLARLGALAAAAAAGLLLLAACGGGSSSLAPGASKKYQQALAFVGCMRTHGMPTFPDPTSQGTVSDSQANVNSALVLTAYRQCRTLLPPGALQLTEAQRTQLTDKALREAQCMQTHGVPGFPEPGAPKSAVRRALAGINPQSPQFQAAARTCGLQFAVSRRVVARASAPKAG